MPSFGAAAVRGLLGLGGAGRPTTAQEQAHPPLALGVEPQPTVNGEQGAANADGHDQNVGGNAYWGPFASPYASRPIEELTVFVPIGATVSISEVLFSLYNWSTLSSWRAQVKLYVNSLPNSGACWSRRALVTAMVRDITFHEHTHRTVLKTCQRSAARLVAAFWDECKAAELAPCQEHMAEDVTHLDVVAQDHPVFY